MSAFRNRRKVVPLTYVPHAKEDCDLGGCDICMSYWELLAVMDPERFGALTDGGE